MHPDANRLSAYLLGQLDEGQALEMANHLEHCDHCEATMLELETSGETRIPDLVLAPAVDDFENEPGCQQMLADIEALGLIHEQATQLGGNDGDTADALGQVGEYELLREIGAGGMGTVYEAMHGKLKRRVALKVLPDQRLGDPDAVARFEREMEAVGNLSHPNLVSATDAGHADNVHYLAMELIEGIDLGKLIRRAGPLAVPDACELIRQVAVGLSYAERKGVVHRDIKPSNLMITLDAAGQPQAKILDMGLARLESTPASDKELTSSGQMMGTLEYMAPEQGTDSHVVDTRADVYALGATLHQLLTGKVPFGRSDYSTPLSLMMAKASSPPPSIGTLCQELPPTLVELVDSMLALSPSERPQTPAEVATRLTEFCGGANLLAVLDDAGESIEGVASDFDTACHVSKTAGPLQVDRPAGSRRGLWIGLIAILGIAALGVVTILVQTRNGTMVVTINDPEDKIQVSVVGEELVVKQAGSAQPVKIRPGKHHLRISRDGRNLDVRDFTIKRGDRVALSVRLVRGAIEVARDGQLIARTPPPAAIPKGGDGSAIASWALESGGRVQVRLANRKFVTVKAGEKLPNGDFDLLSINLSKIRAISDSDMARMASVETLAHLSLDGVMVTAEGIRKFARHPKLTSLSLWNLKLPINTWAALRDLRRLENLSLISSNLDNTSLKEVAQIPRIRYIDLQGTRVDDQGLKHLRNHRTLSSLRFALARERITDAGMEHLKTMSLLNYLDIDVTEVGDRGLLHLSELKKLRRLEASGTKVTPKGVALLKAALPRCEVVARFPD